MTIKFLHTPIEQIDQLCKEEQIVKVTISTYQTELYKKDGTLALVKTAAFGQTIKSSKDLIQFDNEDMKMLSRKVKHQLR